MRWFYFILKWLMWFVGHFWYNIEIKGGENRPQYGQRTILVCNHVSLCDPVVLAIGVKPMIRFMAKAELMHGPLGPIMRGLGIIPVDRGNSDMSPVETCARCIEEGYPVGIFPEGTRYPEGSPGRPKSGMALVAKLARADVIPCSIVFHNGRRFRGRITMTYGERIPYAQLGIENDSPRSLKRATKLVWGRVLEMLGVSDGENE